MATVQQRADFWCRQVMLGRGQWEARLCPRGLLGLTAIPEGTHLALVEPAPDETCDKKNRIVFAAARLNETKE